MNKNEPSSSSLADLAKEYGIEFLPVVPDEILDASLVAKVPVDWARSHSLLPVRIADEVCLLTADPDIESAQNYLSLLIGSEMRLLLAEREVVLQAIERCYYRKDDSPHEFLKDLAADSGEAVLHVRSDDLLQVAEKAPVTQLVNLILLEAVKRRASDIHFEPFESRLRVRYRIDGILSDTASPPKHLEDALVSRLKIMARMDIAERRLPQDGMARVRVGEREIDIRVSTVPVAEGERVVLRLLDKASALLPLSVLGMAPGALQAFEGLLSHLNGMVVVSGPTGSGKTTTLYAALSKLDATRKNIITIEDPIEYQLDNIGQIQVKPKIGLTFASGLRHILRQDPDIILVGETRDVETAEIAIRASLTGHLVFTTLHTNDAPGAVVRLIDMGMEPYLLASCLRGVLAQRLVRTLCPHCRRQVVLPDRELSGLGDVAALVSGKPSWLPVGCPACIEGFKGRSGLFELMVMSREMQERVTRGQAGTEGLRALAERNGMQSLLADGVAKALQGVTSLSEVITAAA